VAKLAEMAKSKQKTTRNRDDAARLEFAIMEPVKEDSFYPKPQEIVNLLAANASRVIAMTCRYCGLFFASRKQNGIENPQVRFCATQLQRMRSNGQAFKPACETHALPNQLRATGLGGGLGRGLGVAWALGAGVGLGVGVGLPEAVAVAVAVGVAVAVAVGVDVGVKVAVGVGVALPIGVAVAVAVAVAVGVGLIVAVAVAVAVAVGVEVTVAVAVAVAVEIGVAVAVGVCVAVGVGVGVGVPPAGTRKAYTLLSLAT
jgi:hypothetical protein